MKVKKHTISKGQEYSFSLEKYTEEIVFVNEGLNFLILVFGNDSDEYQTEGVTLSANSQQKIKKESFTKVKVTSPGTTLKTIEFECQKLWIPCKFTASPSSGDFRTAWGVNNYKPFQTRTTAIAFDLDSSQTTDLSKKIKIEGLDSNFDYQEEIIELDDTDSTTKVTTANDYMQINRFYLLEEVTGDITLRDSNNDNDTQNSLGKIFAGQNFWQTSVYTVPRSKTAKIKNLLLGQVSDITLGSGSDINVHCVIHSYVDETIGYTPALLVYGFSIKEDKQIQFDLIDNQEISEKSCIEFLYSNSDTNPADCFIGYLLSIS